MDGMNRKVIMPKYMQCFKCTASHCEDSCCTGLGSINVDTDTYEKYKNIDDPELNRIIENKILLDSQSQNQIFCGKFDLGKNLTCPLLTSERLCLMQLKKGEDYLPYICFSYPRVSNIVDGILQKSAVMSCPEAARIALLNPAGIELVEVEESSDNRKIVKTDIDTKSTEYINSPNRFLTELQKFSILILKNRDYTLNERLLALGLFCQDVVQYCNYGMAHKNTPFC